MKIIVVKKNSEIQEINWKKNVDLQVLYKKCGFRNNTLFEKNIRGILIVKLNIFLYMLKIMAGRILKINMNYLPFR